MRLKIARKGEDSLEMDFGGEGHTLLNLLQSSLLRQGGVKMAGYSKPHPLMDRSTLFVVTKEGESPEKALLDAVEDAKGLLNEFLDEFNGQVAGLQRRE